MVRDRRGAREEGRSKIANVTVIFQITSWIEGEKEMERGKNEVNELEK